MTGRPFTYGSVCSGIEAATQAWHPLGWQPAFFSEIEKFPSAVLAHHYGSNMPGEDLARNGVPNLGDMTKFQEWPDYAIDLLVGGTPCQSFSVAGLRKGLNDPRGNLMLTYLGIAKRYRPRWLAWENVPGVLSSNGGRDFGTFLRGLEECGYHAAWRVLDSQFVRVDGFAQAVPQRRRRVFVVAYLGDWRRAASVFLEPESLQGHPAPSRDAGEVVAALTANGVGTCGADDNQVQAGHLIARPTVMSSGQAGAEIAVDHATTLTTLHEAPIVFQTRYVRNGRGAPDTIASALTSEAGRTGKGDSAQVVALPRLPHAFDARQSDVIQYGDISGPIDTLGVMGVQTEWDVRRLTPRECERLQAMADGYTDVPYRGKTAADGPRYKALGNSMSVNVMRWIGQRIAHVDAISVDELQMLAGRK